MDGDEDEYEYDPDDVDDAGVGSKSSSAGAGDDEYEYEEYDEDAVDEDDAGASESVGSPSDRDLPHPKRGRVSTGGALAGASGHSGTGADNYRILAPDEIDSVRRKAVREVAGVLELPEDCAEILLATESWSRDRALEEYTTDPDAVKVRVGIQFLGVESEPSSDFLCGVCFATVPRGRGRGMGCDHVFCSDCWGSYVGERIASKQPENFLVPCQDGSCRERLTRSFIGRTVPAGVSADWRRLSDRHFVLNNRQMAQCPSSSCQNSFIAQGTVKEVKCPCGMRFCFRCSREAHQPADCKLVSKWTEKCSNDSETANWVISNTKSCPKCKSRIEKNQGCNHMTCRACRHEFCWICLGPWTEHGTSTGGYYQCNRYDAAKAKRETGDPVSSAKEELDKYLFYYQRFANHERAGRFATNLRKKTQERIERYQAERMSGKGTSMMTMMSSTVAGRGASGGGGGGGGGGGLGAGGRMTGPSSSSARTGVGMSGSSASSSGSELRSVMTVMDVEYLEAATELVIECRRVLKYTYVLGYYMEPGPEKTLFEHLQQFLESSTEKLSELTEVELEKQDRVQVVNFTRVTHNFLEQLLEGVEEGLTAAGDLTTLGAGAAGGGGGGGSGGSSASGGSAGASASASSSSAASTSSGTAAASSAATTTGRGNSGSGRTGSGSGSARTGSSSGSGSLTRGAPPRATSGTSSSSTSSAPATRTTRATAARR